jgi:hypothetical protein
VTDDAIGGEVVVATGVCERLVNATLALTSYSSSMAGWCLLLTGE